MYSGSQLYFATAAFLATHFISSTPLRGVLVMKWVAMNAAVAK